MELALYRKYRPQTFVELVGQNHIRTTLESELETGRIAHAYLFSGPRGLGKTTTARLLAKAVNCQQRAAGKSEPCNSCDSCQEIIASRSIDVIEIDAASHTGVDNVRENIIANAQFTPSRSRFKVFIIDEVHMLSTSAFNALLKTLEEPPAHALFILATTEIHKVPSTIVSRCQHFEFRPVSDEAIIDRLRALVEAEGKQLDDEVLANVAHASGGSIRDAESLLGQILSLDDKRISREQSELVLPRARFNHAFALIRYLAKKDAASALKLINELVQEGVHLDKFTATMIEVLRQLLVIHIDPSLEHRRAGMTADDERQVKALAEMFNLADTIRALEIFLEKQPTMKTAHIVQLPLELAVISITRKNHAGLQPAQGLQVSPSVKPSAPDRVQIKKSPQEKKLNLTKKVKTTFATVQKNWPRVFAGLKAHNHSLSTTLKLGQLQELSSVGVLTIRFEHDFHRKRVYDSKNKQIIETVLAEVFNEPLSIDVIAGGDYKRTASKPSPPVDDSLKSIADAFGGRVVE